MSSHIYKALTVAECIKFIKSEHIDTIQGRPMCHLLCTLLNQLANRARNVPCDYSNYGMSWLVIPVAMYIVLTGENVVAPNQPPQVPVYPPNASQQDNMIINITWQKNKELWENMINMGRALISVAKSKLDPKYRQNLSNMLTGVTDRSFREFFDKLYTKYGRATPFDIEQNDKRMSATWDPTDDIADLLRQIKDGSIFAHYVGHQKNDKELVTIGERAILNTGLFPNQYQNWKRRDEENRTWADFEQFWQIEYDLWHETAVPATQLGYAGATDAAEPNEDVEKAYYDSLQSFGEANQHNAQTFSHMSETNLELVNNMSTQISALTKQVSDLACAVQQQPKPQPPPGFTNTYQQALAYPQPTTYPLQQVYPASYAGHQWVPRGGGRGGQARGRGRGRTNYGRGGRGYNQYQHGAQQQYQGAPQQQYQGVPQQQYQGAPQQQPNPGRGGTGYYTPQQLNPVKFHKNWFYCWSCGYDVDHESQNCPCPAPGHVYHATRNNPCGGRKKGIHKNVL